MTGPVRPSTLLTTNKSRSRATWGSVRPEGHSGQGTLINDFNRGNIFSLFHPTQTMEAAVVWVWGARGGVTGPAGGLYVRLSEKLVGEGIASLRLDYRWPNDLYECVLDTLSRGDAALGRRVQEGGVGRALLRWGRRDSSSALQRQDRRRCRSLKPERRHPARRRCCPPTPPPRPRHRRCHPSPSVPPSSSTTLPSNPKNSATSRALATA